MIGVYAIRNTKNNKMYIGESIDIEQRWKTHQEDLDNGSHHSYKLQEDYDKSKNKEFRFFILEEFIFPFNAKIDSAKLQLILYCREYYYMKKYKSKSKGYNVEFTLAEILDIHSNNLRYPKYQTEDCKKFILNNKDILTTDNFNLNILNELCAYSEENKLGDMVYINANSSPQTFNPCLNAYTDKKGTIIPKSKKQMYNNNTKNNDTKDNVKTKQKSTKIKEPNKEPKPKRVPKDNTLLPATKIYEILPDDYKSDFSLRTLMSIDVLQGYIKYNEDNTKRKYSLSEKGIKSDYYINGDPYTNGYDKDTILLTPLGIERYKEMATHIYTYVSSDMLVKNDFGKFYIPLNIIKSKNNI